MEQKNKQLTTIVNGHPVSFSFSNEPKKDLSGKIRGILLDSFIAQNKGFIRNTNAVKSAQQ